MRISGREDIGVPAEAVFAILCDFAALEGAARRRGADVQRQDALSEAGAGMIWLVAGRYRGRARSARIVLDAYDPPAGIVLSILGGGFEGRVDLGVVALARNRSRLLADVEIRPRTLGARVVIQSLRLGRPAVMRRFHARLRELAARVEARHHALR